MCDFLSLIIPASSTKASWISRLFVSVLSRGCITSTLTFKNRLCHRGCQQPPPSPSDDPWSQHGAHCQHNIREIYTNINLLWWCHCVVRFVYMCVTRSYTTTCHQHNETEHENDTQCIGLLYFPIKSKKKKKNSVTNVELTEWKRN